MQVPSGEQKQDTSSPFHETTNPIRLSQRSSDTSQAHIRGHETNDPIILTSSSRILLGTEPIQRTAELENIHMSLTDARTETPS